MAQDGADQPKRAAGRPRSERTRRAVLKSAFQLLKERGFDQVSVQQIAHHAGVSTATLYRWWSNKHAILLDAYLETTRDLMPSASGATPLARLRAYTLRIGSFLRSENGRVFLRLLMAIQEDRALYDAFYQQVFQPRRAEGCNLVVEAIRSGELAASTDPNFLIDLLLGPQILRALLGQDLSPQTIRRICDAVIRGSEAVGGSAAGESRRFKRPERGQTSRSRAVETPTK